MENLPDRQGFYIRCKDQNGELHEWLDNYNNWTNIAQCAKWFSDASHAQLTLILLQKPDSTLGDPKVVEVTVVPIVKEIEP